MKSAFSTIFILVFYFNTLLSQTIPYRVKSLWGLSDTAGNIISAIKYDSINFINPNLARGFVWKNDKMGVISSNGKEIVPPKYNFIKEYFYFLEAQKGKERGILSIDGQLILPFQYDSIVQVTSSGFIVLAKNKKRGIARFLNNKVNVLKECQYDKVENLYPENIFKCELALKTIYLDTLMKEVNFKPVDIVGVAPDFSFAYNKNNREDTYEKFLKDEEYKIKNKNTHKNDICIQRDSDLFKVIYERKNGLWGVRKVDGTILVPYKYEDINMDISSIQAINSKCKQTYALKLNGKWGMIGHINRDPFRYQDTTTYYLLDFVYDSIISNCNHTFYFVEKDKSIGFVKAKTFDTNIRIKYKFIEQYYYPIGNKTILKVLTENNRIGYVDEFGFEYFKE